MTRGFFAGARVKFIHFFPEDFLIVFNTLLNTAQCGFLTKPQCAKMVTASSEIKASFWQHMVISSCYLLHGILSFNGLAKRNTKYILYGLITRNTELLYGLLGIS